RLKIEDRAPVNRQSSIFNLQSTADQLLYRLEGHLCRYLFHALVSKGAFLQEAGRAEDIAVEDLRRSARRSGAARVGRTEEGGDGDADRSGQVHRPRIVRDDDPGAGKERRE